MNPTAADAAAMLEKHGYSHHASAVYLLLAENAQLRATSVTQTSGLEPGPIQRTYSEKPPISAADVNLYRERHGRRLARVRGNLRGWAKRPVKEVLTLDRIAAAGGFVNRRYASEIRAVLINDRQKLDAVIWTEDEAHSALSVNREDVLSAFARDGRKRGVTGGGSRDGQ